MSGNEADYGYTRDVIASGRKLLAEIDRRAPDGVRWAVRTASATRTLPAQLQDIIASELLGVVRTLTKRARSALDAAESTVNGAGSPTALRELADKMDDNVAAKATDLAPRVRSDALRATTDEVWSGHAASLYRQALEGQGEAVERITSTAEKLASVCRDLASDLNDFIGSLTVSIVGFVGSAALFLAALTSAPETLGGSLLVVGGSLIVLLGSIAALAYIVTKNADTMKQLAKEAEISVQAWPNARFADRG
jgi:hypothetical protein